MSNKIPCGGFYLDDTLNVNESGELSIKGGTPYQQLVTDGTGTAKWEDRLAYETGPVLTEIVPEQSFTGTNHILTGGSKLSLGQTYIVKFDNTEYECICVDLDGIPAIGNAAIIGRGSDTGEPFLLQHEGGFYIDVSDKTSTHTVSVSVFAPTIKKIDEKFLSKGLIVNIVGTESDGLGNTYMLFDKTDDEINNALANGSTVKLNYYGKGNLQYDSYNELFWGVYPSGIGDGITKLTVMSVEKLENGWFPQKTYITTSTGATS